MAAIARDDESRPEPSSGSQENRAEPVGQHRPEVTQAGLVRVQEGLSQVGLPDGVAQALLAVVRCAAAHAQADVSPGTATARVAPPEVIDDAAVLAAAHATRVVAGFAEGALIDAARTLADRAGTELLARRGLCDPAELCATKRQKWGSPGIDVGQAGLGSWGRWSLIGPQESMTRASAARAEWKP